MQHCAWAVLYHICIHAYLQTTCSYTGNVYHQVDEWVKNAKESIESRRALEEE